MNYKQNPSPTKVDIFKSNFKKINLKVETTISKQKYWNLRLCRRGIRQSKAQPKTVNNNQLWWVNFYTCKKSNLLVSCFRTFLWSKNAQGLNSSLIFLKEQEILHELLCYLR